MFLKNTKEANKSKENMQTSVNSEDLLAHLREVRDQWDDAITESFQQNPRINF